MVLESDHVADFVRILPISFHFYGFVNQDGQLTDMVFNNTKTEYSEVHQSEEGSEGEGSSRMLPPPDRFTHSAYRMLMVSIFLCCIVSVAIGFFLGTYGFSLGSRQTSCATEPKKVDSVTGLGMATIDEAPFITDGM